MREPGFWWTRPGLTARLFSPLGGIYGAVAAARLKRQGSRTGIPVFCVGNFTLGGAGKTPTAMAVAKLLIAAGERPFFLSRGYGGRLSGPLRIDLAAHRADDVGDEPMMLARLAPTIVSQDRVAGAEMARADGASIVVMDDGLQNASLAKDLTIAVVDARRGIGNGFVFPAGPLRAPLLPQISYVDAVLMIGKGSAVADLERTLRERSLPVFHGRLEPDPAAAAALSGKKLFAFAGIGNPEKFFATLAEAGTRPQLAESFPDHHPYSPTEAAALVARADAEGLQLVTTEKDMARIAGDKALTELAARTRTLPVNLVVEEAGAFRHRLLEKIGKN